MYARLWVWLAKFVGGEKKVPLTMRRRNTKSTACDAHNVYNIIWLLFFFIVFPVFDLTRLPISIYLCGFRIPNKTNRIHSTPSPLSPRVSQGFPVDLYNLMTDVLNDYTRIRTAHSVTIIQYNYKHHTLQFVTTNRLLLGVHEMMIGVMNFYETVDSTILL